MKQGATAELRRRSAEYAAQLADFESAGFTRSNEIDLKTEGWRARKL